MPVTQTIAFDAPSLAEIGSGTITAFLFSGTSLIATLSGIAENGTLRTKYTGTVQDVAAGTYRLVVKFDGYTISKPEYMVLLALAAATYNAALDPLALGTPVFGHSYQEAMKRIEVVSGSGTLERAGTDSELMTSTDGSKTVEFTVDEHGNVSEVDWT